MDLTRPMRRALAALALVVVGAPLAAAVGPNLSAPLRLWALAIITVSVARPDAGALLAAFMTPISMSVGRYAGAPLGWAEMPALALAAGWLLHQVVRPRREAATRVPLPPALAFAAVVGAAVVVALTTVELYVGPDAFGEVIADRVLKNFFSADARFHSMAAGMMMLEGVAVLVAVAHIAAERPRFGRRFLAMSVAGGAAAALFTVLRLAEAAAREVDPSAAFIALVRSVRFDVHHGDVNAAGSHYVLLLIPALAGIFTRRRTAAAWALAAAALACGIAVAGSRVALVSAVIVIVAGAALALRSEKKRAGAAPLAGILIAGALAAAMIFAYSLRHSSASTAIQVRWELARVALQLTREEPLFGVGTGEFYDRSFAHFADPDVRRFYPRGENAHNNFLQLLAELGVIGLAVFLWLMRDALRGAYREFQGSGDRAHAALCAGLAAFLLTCIGGHPLLVREPAFAFWSLLGAVSTWQPAAVPPRRRRASATAASLILALMVVCLPFRISRARAALDLEHMGYGLTTWLHDDAGTRYRVLRGTATVFAEADAAVIEIPMRLPPGTAAVGVRLVLDGKPVDEVIVSDALWRPVRLILPSRPDPRRYLPIALETAERDRIVWIGKVSTVSVRRGRH